MCGPDEETEPGSNFLDLIKLQDDELEALGVCIQWYNKHLENCKQKNNKKDIDMARKAQLTYDEIKQEISVLNNTPDVQMQTQQK